MKKFFGVLALVAALFVANGAQAQVNSVFGKGTNIISAEIGWGIDGFGQRVTYERSLMTLLNGKAAIGVGGSLGNIFESDKAKGYGYTTKGTADRFVIDVVGSFHYSFVKKLDTYVQLGIGGGVWTSTVKGKYDEELFPGVGTVKTRDSKGIFDFTAALGARYYFNNNWAVNAELGWVARNIIMVGATYKF